MIEIVYKHDDFYVVSKPADVNFHDEGSPGEGFFNRVQSEFNETLFPVHRIDKLTSGLLIVARNKQSAAKFQEVFATHSINKFYLAISGSKPKKKQGWIKGDMAKSRRSAYKLLRTTQNPAISLFFSQSIGNGKRLFLVKPLTGKTHQIRVALASIGAPILGDELYAKGEEKSADRGYLHAYALCFLWRDEQVSIQHFPSQGSLFDTPECQQQLESWASPEALSWPDKS